MVMFFGAVSAMDLDEGGALTVLSYSSFWQLACRRDLGLFFRPSGGMPWSSGPHPDRRPNADSEVPFSTQSAGAAAPVSQCSI